MTISESIEHLRNLQGVDDEIGALEAELEQLPRTLDAARKDHAAVEANAKAAENALAEIQKKRRDLEQQIADADQNVVKFENDKIKVKTNAEFRALNTEIAQQKEIKSALEDRVLLSFDEEETAQKQVDRLEEELAMVKKSMENQEKETAERAERDRSRVEELKTQRASMVTTMDSKVLDRYEAIRDRKGGVAVVTVVRGSCGGCHTQQPPQKVNEIRKRDVLHNCDFCGRFLLWAAEEATAS